MRIAEALRRESEAKKAAAEAGNHVRSLIQPVIEAINAFDPRLLVSKRRYNNLGAHGPAEYTWWQESKDGEDTLTVWVRKVIEGSARHGEEALYIEYMIDFPLDVIERADKGEITEIIEKDNKRPSQSQLSKWLPFLDRPTEEERKGKNIPF